MCPRVTLTRTAMLIYFAIGDKIHVEIDLPRSCLTKHLASLQTTRIND
jgi:hypothetical protein